MRRPDVIARQAARPRGWLGWVMGRIMAVETAAANGAALDHLDIQPADRVLEIGFGHGRTVELAARRAPRGFVAGVDHGAALLPGARRRCADLIAAGRVALHQGDSARLPFPDASFDRTFAVHTLYFWRPPAPHLAEIRRVLAPGGRCVLGYRPAGAPGSNDFSPDVYRFWSVAELHELLAELGFAGIDTLQPSATLCLTAAHAPHHVERAP